MKKPEPRRRMSRLKQLMKKQSISALLVTRREDVCYLTGFTGSAGSLLVAAGRPYLITDFRYKVQATIETTGVGILIQTKDFFTALRDAAERLQVGNTLWFDESVLTVAMLKKLKQQGFMPKGHHDIVETLRQQKDEHELTSIRLAVRRAEQSFRELRNHIKPGVTEQELGLRLEFLIRGNGSRKTAFDTIVASGRNGAMPHAKVTNRRMKKGDLVTFDFGAEANGYYSDMTRTYCLGRPSARQREIHELVLKAQTAAIQNIRPGIPCTSVDDAARGIITKAGHGKHFGHGTGHGIGLMAHEGPSLSPRSQDRVAEDMVFTVEPGVYIPGWGGVRIEDMVSVTKNKAKVLTTLPRELEGLMRL